MELEQLRQWSFKVPLMELEQLRQWSFNATFPELRSIHGSRTTPGMGLQAPLMVENLFFFIKLEIQGQLNDYEDTHKLSLLMKIGETWRFDEEEDANESLNYFRSIVKLFQTL